MICPKCGREVINGSVVCPGCGGNLGQVNQQNVNNNQNININQQNVNNNQNININQQNVDNNFNNMKVGKKFNFIPLVIVGVVLVAVGVFIFFNKNDESNNGKNNETTDKMTFDVENELSDDEVKQLTTCPYNILAYDSNFDENGSFFMAIEDAFNDADRGVFVTGKINRGMVSVGDKVQIIGVNNKVINTTIVDIEQSRNSIKTAKMGEDVGLLLDDVNRDDLQRGQLVIRPNSISTKRIFEADIQLLTSEQGGLNEPLYESNALQYYFFTSDFTGNWYFPDGLNKINPGDCLKVVIESEYYISMEIGTYFSIRKGGRTIGVGIVTETDSSKIKYSKDVVDRYASLRNDPNRECLMSVEDVFTISGRGTTVSVKIESGKLFVGDKIEITGSKGKRTSTVKRLEVYRDTIEFVETGDKVSIILSDIDRDDIERGDKIVLIR